LQGIFGKKEDYILLRVGSSGILERIEKAFEFKEKCLYVSGLKPGSYRVENALENYVF